MHLKMNFKIKLLLSFVIAWVNVQAQNNFRLIVNENFDTDSINYNLWSDKYGWGRSIPSNNDISLNTAGQNFLLKKGILTITARMDSITALIDSTSAANRVMEDGKPNLRIVQATTGLLRAKQRFKYGKFEMRCRLPEGDGRNPAFWLWCGNPFDEIDIFEKPWQFHKSFTTNIHFDSSGVHKSDFKFYSAKRKNVFSNRFNTFTLIWIPGQVQWLLNGKVIRTEMIDYKQAMDLIINLGVSNDDFWGRFPQNYSPKHRGFAIDYIRVWEYVPGN
jgi:beta-glucanase (GH16 family)